MFLQVEHRFAFEYGGYISESFLELRVQPKTTPSQTVASFELGVGPPTRVFRYRDWNDNNTHHFTITKFHDRIEVAARSLVHTHVAGPALAALTDPRPREALPYALRDFLDFGGPVRLTPALRAAHRAAGRREKAPLGEQVLALGEHIRERFEYRKEVTRYDSTTEDFLKIGAGVCQDFTHLMLAFLRLRGIPCRYVSGYLHVERKTREPAQSHAWIEFYAPSAGWVPFDPTHNREVDERYVVVGHGRHYDDVPPNKGIYRGVAKETLSAEVFTQVTAGKSVSTLREALRPIDLPVFREIPERRIDRLTTAGEEVAAQQQQQAGPAPLRRSAPGSVAGTRAGSRRGGTPPALRRCP
jgi:transglutaminase-like putative cysteine protease